MLNEPKRCTKCKKVKVLEEYYVNYTNGRSRSECKECHKKRVSEHQKETQSWKNNTENLEARRAYSLAYYHQHKDQFATYRANFRERHPDYYKNYRRVEQEV